MKNHYYVSCLYGNWSVFRDGIQFAHGFSCEADANYFIERISPSWKE